MTDNMEQLSISLNMPFLANMYINHHPLNIKSLF